MKAGLRRHLGSETRRRLASGAFWGGVGFGLSRCVSILVSFALARLLGPAQFGEYGIVNSTAGMIGGMAGLGIGATVVKHIAEFKVSAPEKASRILALSSLVTWCSAFVYAVAYMVFAPWLARNALAAPHLAPLLKISAFTLAFGLVNSVQGSSLIGCEAFRINTVLSVVCSIGQSVLVALGAFFWGVQGAVGGLALAMLITVLLTRWSVRHVWGKFRLGLTWKGAFREWRVLWDFSLPTFLSGVSVAPVLWGCSAMLAHQADGYAALGVYGAANQWYQAILVVPGLLGMALLPILADKQGRGEGDRGLALMWKMVGINALVTLPLALVFSLASPWIMRAYGSSFAGGHWVLTCVSFAAALLAILHPVGNLLAAKGRMWACFWLNTGWGTAMLGFSWGMVKWGAVGLAVAQLLAYLCHTLWTLGYILLVSRSGRRDCSCIRAVSG
ncbi:MAG: oligosaccharide flippase family protein [Kiritimatiellia bacterium]